MSGIRIVRVLIGIEVHLEDDFLERQFGEICFITPPNLALQIERHVRDEDLGYYPALDFFTDKQQIDQNLLNTGLHLYELVSDAVEREVARRLRPAFSNVYCESTQCHALSLPRVRPGSGKTTQDGLPVPDTDLVAHYRPNRFRMDLDLASVVRNKASVGPRARQEADKDTEKQTRQKVQRWLRNHFESVTILYSSLPDH